MSTTARSRPITLKRARIIPWKGNLQKEAGDHTVRVALKDTENYTWEDGSREEKTYPFAIGKKTITGTWQGLTQVYDGTAKTVTVSLKGLVQGDEGLSATVTAKEGDMTSAGSHLLTATMENYIVVPAEATLEIQKKPVFLTLEDNVAQAGEPFGRRHGWPRRMRTLAPATTALSTGTARAPKWKTRPPARQL